MSARVYTKTERVAAHFGQLTLEAWVSMLLLGVAHSQDALVPAFGYLVVLCLLTVLTGPVFLEMERRSRA